VYLTIFSKVKPFQHHIFSETYMIPLRSVRKSWDV